MCAGAMTFCLVSWFHVTPRFSLLPWR